MSQYNKLSDIQYARFQILHVDLHFGLFWSADIPTMLPKEGKLSIGMSHSMLHYLADGMCSHIIIFIYINTSSLGGYFSVVKYTLCILITTL